MNAPARGPLLALALLVAAPATIRAVPADVTGSAPLRVAVRADSLLRRGHYREARRLAEAGLADATLPDTARSHLALVLGEVELAEGRYRRARRLLTAADSAATARGPSAGRHALRARLGLASLRRLRGDPAAARTAVRRLLPDLPPAATDPVRTAAVLELARCLEELDRFPVAGELLRRHRAAAVAVAGDTCAAAALCTGELAAVLGLSGENAAAVAAFHRAAALAEAVWGRDDPRTARALAGVAHVRTSLGDLSGAAALYDEALGIMARRHTYLPPETADWRCRLALYDLDPAHPDSAARVMAAGLADAARIHGRHSPRYALLRRLEAQLLVRHGEADAAVAVCDSILPVLRRAYGCRHPYLGMVWKTRTLACLELGRTREALAAADSAEAVFAAGGGRDRIELAMVRRWRCEALLAAGRFGEALDLALAAAAGADELLVDLARVTSERETATYARYAAMVQQEVLKVLVSWPDPSPDVVRRVYGAVARGSGRVLDLLVRRRRFLRAVERSPAVAAARADRRRAIRRLAALETEPPGPATHQRRERALAELDAAERHLAAAAARLRGAGGPAGEQGPEPTPAAVAAALDSTDVLVHFVVTPPAVGSSGGSAYGAFVVGPHRLVRFVPLGAAARMDSLVTAWRAAVLAVPPGRRPTARQEAACRRLGRALHRVVWAPLFRGTADGGGPDGGEPRRVWVVPDGALWRLDLAALPDSTGTVVLERWAVRWLAGERFLLATAAGDTVTGRGLLAVAAPVAPGHPALPAAAGEIRAVADLFTAATGEPADCLVGAAATEAAFRRLAPGRRMIHLATHAAVADGDGAAVTPPGDPLARATSPWFRAALLLEPGDGDDGRLTALEITDLDLHGVTWAVLGACATGLGAVADREGVVGLGRALRLAGVRNVVLTLWPVRDAAMAALMRDIYRRRLAGDVTAAAVRGARLAALREARRRWHRIHPVLWGGVVTLGPDGAPSSPVSGR